MSVDGTTNYEFGYGHRRGQCSLDDADMRYLDSARGFAYLEPAEDDANAAGAGPFANFCRIDLTRVGDGFRVRLRGAGCQLRCMEAQGKELNGDYHPRQTPSFGCNEDLDSMRWDEALLCLDPELARLDREMASAYEKARAATGAARDRLVRSQRAWISSRRETCDQDHRRTCLVQAYQARLKELTSR
jgi:uncharacterized protein YecT (DUF1311 family)